MDHPRVLSVGQCGFDHNRIARHLEQSFGARVRDASTFDEALEALRRERFDLVLVNRVNDSDGAPGLNGDGGAASGATLLSPGDVAVDSSGNVFIADTGNQRIRRVSAAAAGTPAISVVANAFSVLLAPTRQKPVPATMIAKPSAYAPIKPVAATNIASPMKARINTRG